MPYLSLNVNTFRYTLLASSSKKVCKLRFAKRKKRRRRRAFSIFSSYALYDANFAAIPFSLSKVCMNVCLPVRRWSFISALRHDGSLPQFCKPRRTFAADLQYNPRKTKVIFREKLNVCPRVCLITRGVEFQLRRRNELDYRE